jgi:hypothetical protein
LSSDAGAPSGNGASGSGSGNPSASDGVNVEQLVNDAVSKAIGARMKRLDLGSQIEAAVQAALSKVSPTAEKVTAQEQAGSDASPERQSLKSLTEELGRMRKQLADQQAAAESANKSAQAERVRSQLQAKFAAKLGADNPLTGTLIDSLYDVKKRIVEQDGRLFVKFVDSYGGEDLKPLDEGVSALFDSEFKHLVASPSKAAGLPPASMVRGAPMGQQGGNAPRNPIYAEIAKSALGENPNLAAMLNSAGNNTPQK